MKKAILLFAAIFLLKLMGLAQPIQWGVRAGLNVTDWGGETASGINELFGDAEILNLSTKNGFTAGLSADIPVSDVFDLESGLYYSQKGVRLKARLLETGLINLNANLINHMNYITIPVLLKFKPADGLNLVAGLNSSYLVSNQLEARAGILGISVGEKFDINNTFRELDLGLTAGVGYEFQNGFNLRATYEYGLSRLDDTINANLYNRGFSATVGYKF